MNRHLRLFACVLAGLAIPAAGLGAPPLQLYVELTPPGEVLRPPPGTYAGPVTISKPIILDGQGKVTIDGGGRGTVVTVRADGAEIRGLRLTRSGGSFDNVDAGILLEADDTVIEGNVLEDVLFGINIKGANGNTVIGNRIESRGTEVGLRGDGIRMWYSHENTIAGNELTNVRDVYITNSSENRIADNRIRGSRVGMQLVFSPDNVVEGNVISDNTTGIVVLYSEDVIIRKNRLMHYRSTSGSALAFKDSSQVRVEENEILHCAVGLVANAPIHPENILYLRNNRFAYNDVAMYFYGEKGGHVIHGNRFEHNLLPVRVTSRTSALANDWRGNYWDDYQGFDRDGDGDGDTAHKVYIYSDRLWMDRPMTAFFRGSPLFEMADFIERLAPFSAPRMVLSDPAPRIR